MNFKECVYREKATGETDIMEALPLIRPKRRFNCRIMIDKGLGDIECHNLDLSEKTCPISPQVQDQSEKIE